MIMAKTGWSIAQVIPRIVCLYLTWISRHVKKQSNSRYSQMAARSGLAHPLCGLISRSTHAIAFCPSVLAYLYCGRIRIKFARVDFLTPESEPRARLLAID